MRIAPGLALWPVAGFFSGLHWPELIVIFIIVLVIFGPRNLPKIGQALGSAIREFRHASSKVMGPAEEEPSAPAAVSRAATDEKERGGAAAPPPTAGGEESHRTPRSS